MGNNLYHYFGVYLEIDTYEINHHMTFRGCKNGHKQQDGVYCQNCGFIIAEKEEVIKIHPRFIVDWILDGEWEDVLHEVTSDYLFERGKIVCIGNKIEDGDKPMWLHFDKYDGGISEPVSLPTNSDVEDMKEDFKRCYGDIISALDVTI